MGYKYKKDQFGRLEQYKDLLGLSNISTASGQGLVLSNDPGYGILIERPDDVAAYGWKDLLGQIIPRTTGAGTPTASAFRGGSNRQYSFAAGDSVDINFHIPHDHTPNTDVHLHVHWGHNGTAISGDLVLTYAATYMKGHNQGIFPAEVSLVQTIPTTDIATTPRWSHRINEIQLSAAAPSASQIDTNDLEPDGLIMLNVTATTIPTITGGTIARPFIFFVDMHYQTTNVATRNKAPSFWE